jgi:signal transduction histidine kinase/CheY-like chemotaxis protein
MLTLDKFEIEVKKLNYLYDNLLTSLIGIFGLSLIIAVSLYQVVEPDRLLLWLMLHTFLVFVRYFILNSYKKITITENNYTRYYQLFFITSILHAIIWGSIPIMIFPPDIEHQMMLMFFVSGLTAATAVSLSPKIQIFSIYILCALLPFAAYYLLHDSSVSSFFATALIFYIVILFKMAKQSSQNIHSNIYLALKNKSLVEQLEEKIVDADAANKAKSEFLSVMSHEIRTPLNAIIGFVQILKKIEQDVKKLKYLTTIDQSSKVLINVINDVLDISKIESGKFTLEMTQFNPKNEFTSIYELFEQNALDKNITFINSISSSLPVCISTDVLRVKQIISNLLSNAIKFTPSDKQVELVISYNKESSKLFVAVKDEGIGISKENISYVTQAFTQADSSTARKYGGTGLGLSIVSNILQIFGSKLKIESTLNEGSTFSFELPIHVIKDFQEDICELYEDLVFPNKHILVAEDNPTNQMLVKILLEEMMIRVTIAKDGVEAEEMFKTVKADLVLMDIDMPNKNGLDAMLSIKKFEREKKNKTPIIALTANVISGDREKYLEKGFDGYLEKPIDTQELTKTLSKFFAN